MAIILCISFDFVVNVVLFLHVNLSILLLYIVHNVIAQINENQFLHGISSLGCQAYLLCRVSPVVQFLFPLFIYLFFLSHGFLI
ncbi:hypothetical protein RchiOBHm_Chr3g0491631 [Rosa chinensis]|uniref:Uncharacterized protein n=1 Tax=Rosa chinensis TaxID=74649 RepID=A0A2P6RGA4_ROSCH|nr:hypothetical protein RchiOBHm_Chr3g0491631 [Rosa chinensis]